MWWLNAAWAKNNSREPGEWMPHDWIQGKRWTNAGEAMNLSYCDMFTWRNTDHGRTELALSCHAIYVRFCDMLVFIGREISWYSKRRTGSVESWNRDNPECRCFVFFHRRFWMSSLFTLFFFLLRAQVRFFFLSSWKKFCSAKHFFFRARIYGVTPDLLYELFLSLSRPAAVIPPTGQSLSPSVFLCLLFSPSPLPPPSSSFSSANLRVERLSFLLWPEGKQRVG